MGGALTRTPTRLLGTCRVDLRIRSITTGASRHHRYAHEYEQDVVDARVWGGIHTARPARRAAPRAADSPPGHCGSTSAPSPDIRPLLKTIVIMLRSWRVQPFTRP
ncbi:uncharacterized protein SAZU_6838 [Streptomyces azureus]|uniref:Uncharacterized protein n=1 Tax=Streptomyces azureus TaxID=146537 RepID=A0A0K8PVL4_STRAJ|nr:uncharacterized protein SAZU_6838 [Streptomyces azureus]